MYKEEIERQLKLSKRQNKDERYDYLDSEFNAINYCIKLEKYTNKLLQENKQVKERIDKAIDYISSNDIELLKYHDIPSETTSYEIVTIDLLKILRGGENE